MKEEFIKLVVISGSSKKKGRFIINKKEISSICERSLFGEKAFGQPIPDECETILVRSDGESILLLINTIDEIEVSLGRK